MWFDILPEGNLRGVELYLIILELIELIMVL
jgi:hypothetical protein